MSFEDSIFIVLLSFSVFTVGNENNTINIESSKNIMGIGHYSLLHAYVCDTLFKRIKLLSDNHLDTNGESMQKNWKMLTTMFIMVTKLNLLMH